MDGASAIGIGLDSFSYHRYFGETTPWETPLDSRWTTADFLHRAAELGVEAVSLQTCYLAPMTSALVDDLRDSLDALGLRRVLAWGHRPGLKGGSDPDQVEALRQTLPYAAALGCSIMRIVCGDQFQWRVPAAERMARLAPILRRLAAEARDLGLTLAIENHADFAMRDLITLIEQVDAPNLGVCFDSGNAARVGDDVLTAAALAGRHIRMVHLKDMLIQDESRGDPTLWWPSTPLGHGHFDLPALFDALRRCDYSGDLFIEMTNMHPSWPDEDAAVAESVAYLSGRLKNLPTY